MEQSKDAAYIPTADFVDPACCRLERTREGIIALRIGEERWRDVQLRLVFPLARTERMVALLETDERYIGTIRDFHELDPGSRRVVEEEIGQQYFRPVILRVQSLRKRMGLNEMEVITEVGPRLIRFRSPREDIRDLGGGHYILTDAAGNRFEIPSIDSMDDTSRALWRNLV